MYRRTDYSDRSVHSRQKAEQEAGCLQKTHRQGDRVSFYCQSYCVGGRKTARCGYAQNYLGIYGADMRDAT